MTPNLAEKLGILRIPISLPEQQLRELIKAILRKNHPDVTGGAFNNKEQELQYKNAVDALELLNAPTEEGGSGRDLQVIPEGQNAIAQTASSLAKIVEEQKQQIIALQKTQDMESSEAKASSAISQNIR
jgi:hypothetical protein